MRAVAVDRKLCILDSEADGVGNVDKSGEESGRIVPLSVVMRGSQYGAHNRQRLPIPQRPPSIEPAGADRVELGGVAAIGSSRDLGWVHSRGCERCNHRDQLLTRARASTALALVPLAAGSAPAGATERVAD